MRTPKHFEHKAFTQYIYDCALRDRETYLEIITSGYGEPSDDDKRWIAETKAEIDAIKYRKKEALSR